MANPMQRKDRISYSLLESEPVRAEYSQSQVVPIVKRKKPGSRLWMRFDASGRHELLDIDRNAIMRRASLPARDLRILGPIFSQSSHILARERAMVVNLEFVKAIVTAEELYLLEATNPAVLPFVEQLKEQFPLGSASPIAKEDHLLAATEVHVPIRDLQYNEQWNPLEIRTTEGLPEQLPFEFRVLEIALDVVSNFLDARVRELEQKAYPILDEFTKNISTSNLERVRSLKSVLTRLTARVQKVRDELEQLLDDDKDMGDLYLTRKLTQAQLLYSPSSQGEVGSMRSILPQKSTHWNGATSMNGSVILEDGDVEELEMLLEAYFMPLDGTLNKLAMIREYIDNTEDYINIQLDHKRNQLFQFQITLTTAGLAVSVCMGLCAAVSMNIPIPWYNPGSYSFAIFLPSAIFVSALLFFGLLGYVQWKGLFER